MWVAFLTMSTVGYGDYYPITYIGRIMAILSCIWGNFLQSLFVVSLISSAEFSKIEYRAYDKIKRHFLQRQLEEAQKGALKYSFRYYRTLKKYQKIKQQKLDLKKPITKFSFLRKSYEAFHKAMTGLKFKRNFLAATISDIPFNKKLEPFLEHFGEEIGIISKQFKFYNKVWEKFNACFSLQEDIEQLATLNFDLNQIFLKQISYLMTSPNRTDFAKMFDLHQIKIEHMLEQCEDLKDYLEDKYPKFHKEMQDEINEQRRQKLKDQRIAEQLALLEESSDDEEVSNTSFYYKMFPHTKISKKKKRLSLQKNQVKIQKKIISFDENQEWFNKIKESEMVITGQKKLKTDKFEGSIMKSHVQYQNERLQSIGMQIKQKQLSNLPEQENFVQDLTRPSKKEHLQFSNNPWEQMEFNRLPNSIQQLIKLTNQRQKKAKQKPKTDILELYNKATKKESEKFQLSREQIRKINEINKKKDDKKKKKVDKMVSFKKREIDKGELYHKMIFGFDKDKFK